MKARLWHPGAKSPWLTRSEAADYLRWHIRTIDRYLVPMKKDRTPGKMRVELQNNPGRKRKIRILAEDVYAICPLPVTADSEPIKLAV